MTDRELLEQALEALELRCGTHAHERDELIPALRKRLEQSERVGPKDGDNVLEMWDAADEAERFAIAIEDKSKEKSA